MAVFSTGLVELQRKNSSVSIPAKIIRGPSKWLELQNRPEQKPEIYSYSVRQSLNDTGRRFATEGCDSYFLPCFMPLFP